MSPSEKLCIKSCSKSVPEKKSNWMSQILSGVLENFAKPTEMLLCCSWKILIPFLSGTVVFLWILRNFQKQLLCRTTTNACFCISINSNLIYKCQICCIYKQSFLGGSLRVHLWGGTPQGNRTLSDNIFRRCESYHLNSS